MDHLAITLDIDWAPDFILNDVSQHLIDAGLIHASGRDFFSDRLMIPIHDMFGAVIGFSARAYTKEYSGPKYVNTPETLLFKKSRILFGLHTSRRHIAKERKAIIVEGQIDAMRLIYSGLFDKFPGLKFILGHLGEALPFLMKRIDWAYVRPFDPDLRPGLSKKPSEYIRENTFVTTSGNHYEPAFMCAREALGIDRILLGTDYPYEGIDECIQFLDGLSISDEEKDKIYSKNAKQLGIQI